MDTKKKYGLLLLTLLAIVLSGCFEKLMVERPTECFGKNIPMEFRYKQPFKLGDTIWIKYSVGQRLKTPGGLLCRSNGFNLRIKNGSKFPIENQLRSFSPMIPVQNS